MFRSLMTRRKFAPLFFCQFFAAFGDNFLKAALSFLIAAQIVGAKGAALITLAGGLFIAPYFFLSGLGGEIADRYDKAWVAQRIKFVEMGAAALAVLGFAIHSIPLLFVALFLFGTLGSLFGPVKYGILPDHLAPSELPGGNALIEGGTFLAILLGTIVAGLAANGESNPIHFAWLMLLTALASWLSSLLIPPTGEGAPTLVVNRNILASTWDLIKELRTDSRLWWGAIVVSWFWLVGALVLSLLLPLGHVNINADRRSDHGLSCRLLGGGRHWLVACGMALLRPHRHPADADRRRADWSVLARPCADGLADHACDDDVGCCRLLCGVGQHSHSGRSGRAGNRRRLVRRADVRRGAGLGAQGPPRPRGGRRQCAQCRVHGGRGAGSGAAAGGRFHGADAAGAHRRRQLCGGGRHRFHHAGELDDRFSLDRVPRLPSSGSEGLREYRQSRQQRHHRAQSRQLPRSTAGHVAAAQAADIRRRRDDVAALVDSAVPEIRAHHGARSAQAVFAARDHQRGARRQYAGHLPRRPHHRHRQPDEGLRWRRDDRRQVGRDGGAGPYRRAGGHDFQPVEEHAGAAPAVSKNYRQHP